MEHVLGVIFTIAAMSVCIIGYALYWKSGNIEQSMYSYDLSMLFIYYCAQILTRDNIIFHNYVLRLIQKRTFCYCYAHNRSLK